MIASDRAVSTVLVGISNPATMPRMVDLAIRLHGVTGCEIVATHVVAVHGQVALRSARSSPEVVEARLLLQDMVELAAARGVAARAVVEIGRETSEGLVNAARSYGADLVLVGYSEAPGGADEKAGRRFDRVMHRVARGVDADLVVAKFRRDEDRRLLVPVEADSRLGLIGLLVRSLTADAPAAVRFLHVIPADAPEADGRAVREALADEGLLQLGELEVVASDDVARTLMDRADDHDLAVLQTSPLPTLADDVFGTGAERIAERVSCSVLLVRERPRS